MDHVIILNHQDCCQRQAQHTTAQQANCWPMVYSRDIECSSFSLPQNLKSCFLPNKLLADQVAEGNALTSPGEGGRNTTKSESIPQISMN